MDRLVLAGLSDGYRRRLTADRSAGWRILPIFGMSQIGTDCRRGASSLRASVDVTNVSCTIAMIVAALSA